MNEDRLIRQADGSVRIRIDGLELPVGSEAMDDFELFDQLNRLDEANAPMVLPRIIRGLFGDEKFNDVMDHLRDAETGRVRFEAVMDFLTRVLAVIDPKSRNFLPCGQDTEAS